jgi:catechol 2,3-dioxygenase-like lactoylglutathione lyase family enzyme
MEQRLSLVTLGVREMARARGFYERLGWRASSASNEAVTFFQAGGVVFGLYSREALAEDASVSPDGSGFSGVALAHNTQRREAVDAVIAEAEAAGGTVVKPAEDVFWGGYSGYFADPDGHLWEVAWNPHFPFDDAGNLVVPA